MSFVQGSPDRRGGDRPPAGGRQDLLTAMYRGSTPLLPGAIAQVVTGAVITGAAPMWGHTLLAPILLASGLFLARSMVWVAVTPPSAEALPSPAFRHRLKIGAAALSGGCVMVGALLEPVAGALALVCVALSIEAARAPQPAPWRAGTAFALHAAALTALGGAPFPRQLLQTLAAPLAIGLFAAAPRWLAAAAAPRVAPAGIGVAALLALVAPICVLLALPGLPLESRLAGIVFAGAGAALPLVLAPRAFGLRGVAAPRDLLPAARHGALGLPLTCAGFVAAWETPATAAGVALLAVAGYFLHRALGLRLETEPE
jgi:hypothetical protein